MFKPAAALPLLLLACSGPSRAVDRSPQPPQPQARAAEAPSEVPPLPDLTPEPMTSELSYAEPDPQPSLEPEAPELSDPHSPPELRSFTLRRGETPAHFARWSGLPVETIAEASDLDLNGQYAVGTPILIPLDAQGASALETRRQAHHARRAEGWLARQGVPVQNGFHTVRTGETAWTIATEQLGVPVWLLEVYNPSVDLEALRAGQQLMVPVLADTVVDAEF